MLLCVATPALSPQSLSSQMTQSPTVSLSPQDQQVYHLSPTIMLVATVKELESSHVERQIGPRHATMYSPMGTEQ